MAVFRHMAKASGLVGTFTAVSVPFLQFPLSLLSKQQRNTPSAQYPITIRMKTSTNSCESEWAKPAAPHGNTKPGASLRRPGSKTAFLYRPDGKHIRATQRACDAGLSAPKTSLIKRC